MFLELLFEWFLRAVTVVVDKDVGFVFMGVFFVVLCIVRVFVVMFVG